MKAYSFLLLPIVLLSLLGMAPLHAQQAVSLHWQHGTTLKLQNGQHWRVKDDSSLVVRKPLASPEVRVSPGFLGSWTLKVQGYNTSARVEPAN